MPNFLNSNLSSDKYKIIEDRYLTLIRYLKLFLKKHDVILKEDIDLILEALDDTPLTTLDEDIKKMYEEIK